MANVAAKVKNWWWYNKIYVLLAVLILAAGVYLAGQSAGKTGPDYHIGLVTVSSRSDEELRGIQDAFAALGCDQNGDGQVLVQLHTYTVDLADTSENAGYNNYGIIAALDADLVGKVSGVFLLENPEAFQKTTNGLLKEPFALWSDGLYLCLRSDAAEPYIQLFDHIG